MDCFVSFPSILLNRGENLGYYLFFWFYKVEHAARVETDLAKW